MDINLTSMTRTEVTVRLSKELLRLIAILAVNLSKSTKADPPGFYARHYYRLSPHFEAIAGIVQTLGIRADSTVLEIGSGIGTRCILGSALTGAAFTGLEPCGNSYAPLKQAIDEFRAINSEFGYDVLCRTGEDTGLPDNSFDFVFSNEVLEHVDDPKKVIWEVARVLKPGGRFFFSTCNYNSFYEGHYRCAWFPFLDKRSAARWVEFLGYNPVFLNEINFITKSRLLNYLRSSGLEVIGTGYPKTSGLMPKLSVVYSDNFEPELCDNRDIRHSLMGKLIQHPLCQKALGIAGMEYKLCGVAKKIGIA